MLAEEILSQIEIVPVSELLPHEQTISQNLKKLKEAMLNIGQLVDPIVIDKKTKLVLDGNHRRKVLEVIECPNSVCQVVDYQSDEIKVGTWYPALESSIDTIVNTKGLKVEEVDASKGIEALTKFQAPFMVCQKVNGKEKSYLINPGSYKLMETIEEQNYVFSTLTGTNNFHYISDDLASEYLQKNMTIFFRRHYTKDEIIKTAQSHYPFPPKSTRHFIPNRIIRLNMRLGWLHEGKEEAMGYLRHMLEKRVYEGNVRRYSEPVIVIY